MNYYVYKHWEGRAYLGGLEEDSPSPGSEQSTLAYDVLTRRMPPPPLDEYHTPMRVRPSYWSRRLRPPGDFASDIQMILSQSAVDALRPMLDRCGVLYPLNALEVPQPYWLFHVTNTIDCLDVERSEGYVDAAEQEDESLTYTEDEAPKYVSLYSFYLDRSKLDGKNSDIFCVPQFPDGQYVFVSENFRSAIEKYQLTGVELHPEGINWLKTHGKSAIVLNKSVRSLGEEASQPKKARRPTEKQWLKEVQRIVDEGDHDALSDLRAKLNEHFAQRTDSKGLRAFFRQIAELALPVAQATAFVEYDDSEFVGALVEALEKAGKSIAEGSEIKAVYYEYYYDGGPENDGNFLPLLNFEWVNWASGTVMLAGSRAGAARRSEPLTPRGRQYAGPWLDAAQLSIQP